MHQVAGQGMDFLDFREYRPGDDIRTIDWRASARGRDVYVRRYCGDLAADWYLCVDSSASMGIREGANWTLARKLAAALAYLLLHLGHRVGLLLFSEDIEAARELGRGYPQYARILRTLYSHTPRASGGGSDPAACVAVAGQRRPLIVVSDFLAEDAMVPTLARLAAGQRQLHLFQLDAAPPGPLPERNSVLLQDVESGEVAVCADPGVARGDAARRLALVQRELAEWARRFHVPHTIGSGDDNWRELMLRHFIGG